MSLEENKAHMRRVLEEVFSEWNLPVAGELSAADYVEHPWPPGWPTSLAGLEHLVSLLRAAFPDFHYTVENILAEEDKVAVRVTARGIHDGMVLGYRQPGSRWPGKRCTSAALSTVRSSNTGKSSTGVIEIIALRDSSVESMSPRP